jgi:phosphoglucosamine mutase
VAGRRTVKLFGTDGIRGEAGAFPLDQETVFRLGEILAPSLGLAGAEGRVIVGGDTRESTPALVAAICAGLASGGVAVEHAGVVPTPAIAALVILRGAAAGISISASHNPWQDNGIKIFGPDGRKWPDSGEAEIERRLAEPAPELTHGEFLVPPVEKGLAAEYLGRLPELSLAGMNVLLDCGNGAAYRLAPEAFAGAGARVKTIFSSPSGRNINEACGALHPETLSREVSSGSYALGAAFDGDADRVILCDETGRVLDGDDVLWMISREERAQRRLDPPLVVGTVMSNFGLETSLNGEGVELRRAAVGDRHVARMMEETRARLGGEPSGHVILSWRATTGDGILTALEVASLVKRSGRPLSRLADLKKMPQALRSVRVQRRLPLDEVVQLAQEVARAQEELAGGGRVLLRYSGTEPLLRVMVEGQNAAQVNAIAARLGDVALRELGSGP